MITAETATTIEPEFSALETVYAALKELDARTQRRVLVYVGEKLGLNIQEVIPSEMSSTTRIEDNSSIAESSYSSRMNSEDENGLEGISPIARKWMTRNSLTAHQLGSIFSLGMDEIDLVANAVPGTSKKSKTRSVFLLKGISAYLSSGAARVSHEEIKEACLHYDAYDPPNHAAYLKGFISELSGSKESGYTLTARGLSSATTMIKEMLKKDLG